MSDIYTLLLTLGVPPNSRGFLQTAYAVSLALSEKSRLLHITKSLYPDVAHHFHTSASCIERNIRIAVNAAWDHDSEKLVSISCGFLTSKPTASEFLSILVLYLSD